jgi:RNA recognition motif-containing protein
VALKNMVPLHPLQFVKNYFQEISTKIECDAKKKKKKGMVMDRLYDEKKEIKYILKSGAIQKKSWFNVQLNGENLRVKWTGLL